MELAPSNRKTDMKHLAIAVLSTLMCVPTWAEEIFIGTPISRTELAGEQVQRTMLDRSSQSEFQVIIQRDGDRYFWKTREMKELERHESGIFVTYQAIDGSGYVRIDSSANASSPIGYIEHLNLGLATLTYQGQVSK